MGKVEFLEYFEANFLDQKMTASIHRIQWRIKILISGDSKYYINVQDGDDFERGIVVFPSCPISY